MHTEQYKCDHCESCLRSAKGWITVTMPSCYNCNTMHFCKVSCLLVFVSKKWTTPSELKVIMADAATQ